MQVGISAFSDRRHICGKLLNESGINIVFQNNRITKRTLIIAYTPWLKDSLGISVMRRHEIEMFDVMIMLNILVLYMKLQVENASLGSQKDNKFRISLFS